MFEIEKKIKKIGELLSILGGVAIVLMMLHVVADVLMKYLFNSPVDGTTEIVAAYYMVGVVFLPLAYVTSTKGHLTVELFTRHLPDHWLKPLIGFTQLVTLVYLTFIIYHTVVEAVFRTKEGEAWETSVDLVAIWPSRWFLPFGFGVMAFYILIHTINQFREKNDADSEIRLDI